MSGWTEDEYKNQALMAPCGLYCGTCGVYIAHRDNNTKFKEKLMPVYKAFAKTVDDIACTGCLSEGIVFPVCRSCPIKKCSQDKGINGCHQCDDFPCKFIENFPIQVGKRVILRAIPTWREVGTEKYVEEEEKGSGKDGRTPQGRKDACSRLFAWTITRDLRGDQAFAPPEKGVRCSGPVAAW